MSSHKMKIGVVGTGMAGLSCAWLLSQKYEVSVFEKSPTIGFDNEALEIKVPNTTKVNSDGKLVVEEGNYRVDVPLRVFDPQYYRNLNKFYDILGVEHMHVDYRSCFHKSGKGENKDKGDWVYFRYVNYVIGKLSLPFANPLSLLSPTFLRIGYDAMRLYIMAPFHLREEKVANMTWLEYLRHYNYSTVFIENVMLPAVSAMCTCNYEHTRNYPAPIILTYLSSRAFRGTRTVTGGSKDVVEKITQKFAHVYCNTHVTSVTPTDDGKVAVRDGNGNNYVFDHVVVATQANHAKPMLTKASEDLKRVLGDFVYDKVAVHVHTDQSVMPKNRREWGNTQFGYIPGSTHPMATLWLNNVLTDMFRSCETEIFQTVYPTTEHIDKHKNLGTIKFERPIMNKKSVAALQALAPYQGKDNIWFCGAHVIYGIPLLENATKSGIYIAEKLGAKCPWEPTGITLTPPKAKPLPFFLQFHILAIFVVLIVASLLFLL